MRGWVRVIGNGLFSAFKSCRFDMIYCFGLRARYEPKLDSGQPFFKIGRGLHDFSFHDGGAVFLTENDAMAFMLANQIEGGRSVYGVLAEWDVDTIQLPNEPYRRLVKSSPIVRLPFNEDMSESSESLPRSDVERGGGG